MYKKTIIIVAVMAMALGVNAQHDTVAAADTSRWDFHLSTGTSMVSVGGKGNAYMWLAPSVDYRASERLTLRVTSCGAIAAVWPLCAAALS